MAFRTTAFRPAHTDFVLRPAIARDWPRSIQVWFTNLMMDTPKSAPEVSIDVWRDWLKSVDNHGLNSLLFSRLRNYNREVRPPSEIFAIQRTAYLAEVARIMVRRNQLQVLIKRLEAVGIMPVVLKGAAFGETVYDNVFQRPSADIDILVPQEKYEEARKVLLKNGYRSRRGDRSSKMSWSCDEEFVPTVEDESRQYVVELHWSLTSDAQLLERIKTAGLFGRSEQVVGLNSGYQVLHPVDALVYACLHLFYKHINEMRLIWLYDIHLLAERVEGLGMWDEAVALSWEWQARLALKNCLELANEWFETPVPEIVRDLTSRPADFEEVQSFNLVAYQLEHGQRAGWLKKHLFQLGRLTGLDKFHYLKSHIFPSRQEIESNYPGLRMWPGPLVHIGRLAMMFVTKKS